MGQIVALDRNMVNMIAAGEVIERPASVVKELMENSIDAGATSITVSLEDGGRKLIAVSDDGCGMDAEDLGQAFEPHTTSKIRNCADLLSISTLGFRGEALASIASVAQVRAVSRTRDAAAAHCIEIDCGEKGAVSPCSGDYGTTIQVRDLFYKMPARRKFLRTANTEMSHITEQFTRIALAKVGHNLTLMHNGREVYRLAAGRTNMQERERISQLFSSEIADDLMELDRQENRLHVRAMFGKPGIARTSNKFQYVFLNGRFIRDKFISHALKEAYRGTIEPDRFGVVFLFLEIPYEDVDVNVHPTKIEVRFYNANLVHSQVLGCLREKLLGSDLDMQARLPSVSRPAGAEAGREAASGPGSQRIADAMAEFLKKHRPGPSQRQFTYQAPVTHQVQVRSAPSLQAIQIHDSYIVAQTEDGFVIIDQHALHERILYEDLSQRIRTGKLESQRLLIPESFELSEAEADAVERHGELLAKLGIELAPFGPRTMAVQSFPVLLANASAVDCVRDLLGILADKEFSSDAERLADEVLNMAACKGAIKAGQKLSDAEIEQLLGDRKAIEYASRCPHGRPAVLKFSLSDLEKQFKRT